MLKFIELQQKLDSREVAFQNILCWSLSSQYDELYVRIFLFQNILCWSLSRKGSKNERKHKCISKHLMLKFIVSATHWLKAKYLFQNILCWSLSWSVRTSSGKHLHFKTSYVEVYPNNYRRLHGGHAYFKTSYVEVYLPRSIRFRLNNLNFKTSYVEVYPLRRLKITPIQLNFKTSYVEVYLNPLYNLITRNVISKHLMLKFIHPIS